MLISTFKISYERAPSFSLTMVYIFSELFCRKIMQGLFSVLETELQSFIHFADRLHSLYVYHHHYYYYYYYYYVELSTGFFLGEKYPVESHPETLDFQHFSEDMCRSKECRLLHRSCSVLNS